MRTDQIFLKERREGGLLLREPTLEPVPLLSHVSNNCILSCLKYLSHGLAFAPQRRRPLSAWPPLRGN